MRWQSIVKTTHIWIGIIFGAFLCITCLSGSVAVFRPELEAAFSPKVTSSEVRADLDDAASRVLALHPEAKLTRVLLPAPRRNTFVLQLESDGKSTRRIVIDADTGAVAGELSLPWLDWIIDLHHNMLSGRPGRRVVGVVGIVLFTASLSGLFLSLLRKPSWKSMITVRTGKPWRRFHYELHRATGLWACAFLTLLSFTGIGLAYPEALRLLAGQDAKAPRPKLSGKQSFRPLRDYLNISRAELPGAQITELRLPKSPKDPISVRFRVASDLGDSGRNELALGASGQVISVRRLADQPFAARLQSAFTPIHYGEVGGLLVKILWGLAGVAPTVLFITGLLFWWRKKPRRTVEPNRSRQESSDEFLVTPRSF
jgi:uncharacterized iron-regulated membrane protein